MSATHVTGVAAWDGERLRLVDPVVFNAGMKKLKPAAGETFVVTVMHEEDAVRPAQYRYYFGRIINPLVEWSGNNKAWWDALLKTLFFPEDGRTSKAELSSREFADFISTCEEFVVVEFWEAFESWEERHGVAA